MNQWSLTSLREKLVKIGAKVVRHGRYVIFQMAEVAVPRELFQDIGSLRNCGHRRLRRWCAALDRTVFESKRQETCALMAEKAEVCGTDCAKSATPAENHLSIRGLPRSALSMWPGRGILMLRRHVIWRMSG